MECGFVSQNLKGLVMEKIKRRYNWKRDKQDSRDYSYKSLKIMYPKIPRIVVPPTVDLQPWCSPVVDQGEIGSCSGNALAGAYEYLELRDIRYKLSPTGNPTMFDPAKFSPVSRLFIYYEERVLEGTVDEDSGAEIRDGIKVLARQGACREILWPYGDSYLYQRPVQAAYEEAAQHKVLHYLRLLTLDDIRHCLANEYPVALGFNVYDNFESDYCAQTGDLKMPTPEETLQGGHAVLAVGYNDSTRKLKIKNSWGPDWGLKGYFMMDYSYIEQGLANDFWTLRK